MAFFADGMGSTVGGLLGTSALTCYVESAAAVREGGRTGLTALVCSAFFFLRQETSKHKCSSKFLYTRYYTYYIIL